MFFWFTAMHYTLKIISQFIYYRLWMAMVTDALEIKKKCNRHSVCSHFYFTILCLINLKITFYCIWLYLYIYLHKYIYIMSMYKRFCFRYLLLWIWYLHFYYIFFFDFGTKVNVLRTIGWKQMPNFWWWTVSLFNLILFYMEK